MRELSHQELRDALAYAEGVNEKDGENILEHFQLEQTALAQTIFGIFPDVIAEENQEMSYLFIEFSFNVLCVFQKSFGPLPSQNDMDYDWLEKQAVLLDAELQSLITERHMDEKIRLKLQDRFIERVIEDSPQMGLIKFMNAAIDEFASENPSRVSAIKTTQTMIFIVIRLFSNLYNHKTNE